MQGNLYVGVSAQVALQRRLETIAHNVANASTAGFRAEEVRFETLLSRMDADPVAFATTGPSFLSRRSGEFVRTDNLFDVAVARRCLAGDSNPRGRGLYPRRPHAHDRRPASCRRSTAIRSSMPAARGMLLDPNGGPPRIARDGTISQGTRQVGAIGLFTIDNQAKLTRFENSGVIPDQPATPVLDFSRSRHAARLHRERQRQRRAWRCRRLISVTRAFEMVSCFAGRVGIVSAGSH